MASALTGLGPRTPREARAFHSELRITLEVTLEAVIPPPRNACSRWLVTWGETAQLKFPVEAAGVSVPGLEGAACCH